MKNVSFFIALLLFTSCSFFDKDIVFKPLCYSVNNYTGIDTLININGYYSLKDTAIVDGEEITYSTGIVFYSDGTFVYRFNPVTFKEENKKRYYRYWIDWGLFSISGDTIKAKFVNPKGEMSRSVREAWYKIIDKNTVEQLYFKYWDGITTAMVENRFKNKRFKAIYGHFVPENSLPDPDENYVKQKKRFWCNKEEYKKYMKSIKNQ